MIKYGYAVLNKDFASVTKSKNSKEQQILKTQRSKH